MERRAPKRPFPSLRRVLGQANADERDTVFEVLRRRAAVLPDLVQTGERARCAPVSSPGLATFYEEHAAAVALYIFYRDRGDLGDLADTDDERGDGDDGSVRGPKPDGRRSAAPLVVDPEALAALGAASDPTSPTSPAGSALSSGFTSPKSVSIASTPAVSAHGSRAGTPKDPADRKRFAG